MERLPDCNCQVCTLKELNEFYICGDIFVLLIAGTRTYEDYLEFSTICDRMLSRQDHIMIVSGGANGTDSMAKRYAKDHDIPIKEFQAEWDKYGKSAGYIRNKAMHEYISHYMKRGVLLFWDGESHGTKHSIQLSAQYNNPIKIYNFVTKKFEKVG